MTPPGASPAARTCRPPDRERARQGKASHGQTRRTHYRQLVAEDQGEAVALGMMAAAHLAFRQGRIGGDVVDQHRQLISGLGLPTEGEFRLADMEQAWMRDKKYRHGVRFVVLNELGRPEGRVTADTATLDGALRDLAGR